MANNSRTKYTSKGGLGGKFSKSSKVAKSLLEKEINKLNAYAKGKRVLETVETGDKSKPFRKQVKPLPAKEKGKKK